jgi:hypothetical protein
MRKYFNDRINDVVVKPTKKEFKMYMYYCMHSIDEKGTRCMGKLPCPDITHKSKPTNFELASYERVCNKCNLAFNKAGVCGNC